MPSTIWPPLQPLFLAAIYAIAGVHVAAVQIVQTILFVGCGVLLRAIWRRVDGSVRAANVAAALFLLNPANAAYAHWLWPEVTHLFLVLLVFWLLIERPASRIAAGAAGLCAGPRAACQEPARGFLAGVPDRVRAQGAAALSPRQRDRVCPAASRSRPRRRSGTAGANTAGR